MSSTLLKNIVGSSIYPNRGWVSLEGIDWRMKFKWFNGRSVSIEIFGIVVGVVKEITIEKKGGFLEGHHTAGGLNSGCRNRKTQVIALWFESCKSGWIKIFNLVSP